MRISRFLSLFFLAGCLGPAALFGGDLVAGVVPNWPAPATWLPPRGAGVHTLADATPPLPFVGLPPCRLLDTRGTVGVPINTGGAFAANEVRTWVFTGLCGIPVGAGAVSLNVTVTNTASNPFGFIKIWPGGGTQPNVSTLNWSTGGVTESNAAVVPFGTSPAGSVSAQSANASSDVIIDTNGYYASTPATTSNSFRVSNSGPYAIYAQTSSSATDAAGVYGLASSSTGVAPKGVWGESAGTNYGIGVFGRATASTGYNFGVWGWANSTTGGTAGVIGEAFGTTGILSGVEGYTTSTSNGAAGVYGVDGSGDPGISGLAGTVGVRGASILGYGVYGASEFIGIKGALLNSSGLVTQAGYLGYSGYGVWSFGDYGGTGAKFFVEPHPSDASKVIRYVSLEGPESGTYFRGTARTVRGEATIEVPESFRMVTDEEGLTVQVSPVGPLVMISVESEDLNQIVVRSSKDVTFHYLVQGVRRAFKDHQAISEGREFMPESAEQRMPLNLTEEAKRRLIANGTYNPDGTVNLETAERLGWAKAWKGREEKAKAAAAASVAARKRDEDK